MAQWRKVVVSGSTAELNHISASGDIVPVSDAGSSLGSAGLEWDNLYIDGTANIDSLVADTADIDGGTVDNATIGANTHTSIKGTTIDATTDFTIGGTVITDNTITDDGTLVIYYKNEKKNQGSELGDAMYQITKHVRPGWFYLEIEEENHG